MNNISELKVKFIYKRDFPGQSIAGTWMSASFSSKSIEINVKCQMYYTFGPIPSIYTSPTDVARRFTIFSCGTATTL